MLARVVPRCRSTAEELAGFQSFVCHANRALPPTDTLLPSFHSFDIVHFKQDFATDQLAHRLRCSMVAVVMVGGELGVRSLPGVAQCGEAASLEMSE